MKKDIHPATYRKVIFADQQSEARFLIGSTIETDLTDKWEDGKEYPLFKIEVSSLSHPFYTGDQKLMDTAGRAERFRQRAAKAKVEKDKKDSKQADTESES